MAGAHMADRVGPVTSSRRPPARRIYLTARRHADRSAECWHRRDGGPRRAARARCREVTEERLGAARCPRPTESTRSPKRCGPLPSCCRTPTVQPLQGARASDRPGVDFDASCLGASVLGEMRVPRDADLLVWAARCYGRFASRPRGLGVSSNRIHAEVFGAELFRTPAVVSHAAPARSSV